LNSTQYSSQLGTHWRSERSGGRRICFAPSDHLVMLFRIRRHLLCPDLLLIKMLELFCAGSTADVSCGLFISVATGSAKTQRDLLPSTTTASKLTIIDVAVRQLTGMCRIDRIVIVVNGILEERGGTREHPACDRVCLQKIRWWCLCLCTKRELELTCRSHQSQG
jgi:hypothetical protein